MPQEVVRTPVGYKTIETGAAPARAIFPVFHTNAGFPPDLAYKVEVLPDPATTEITILGRNLDGITGVNVDTDVNVGGNGAEPPFITNTVFGPTSIVVTLDSSQTDNGDFWGIFLTDADGNVYEAPSPIEIFVPE